MLDEDIKNDLEHALNTGELAVVFQPQYTHHNNMFTVAGVEALARLTGEHGTISPASFIPIAENYGLIAELGLYVLDKSCAQLREWIDMHLVNTDFTMSVNISARALGEKDAITDMCAIIHKYRIPHNQLCVEVTESSFIEDVNIATLHKLSFNGMKVSIDDFGTGYSSLARLKNLPVDEIKIDKMFIDEITTSTADIAMLTALNQLFNALDLYCIVEGVETNEQLFILIGIGFTHFQGYFFSKAWDGQTITETIKLTNF